MVHHDDQDAGVPRLLAEAIDAAAFPAADESFEPIRAQIKHLHEDSESMTPPWAIEDPIARVRARAQHE